MKLVDVDHIRLEFFNEIKKAGCGTRRKASVIARDAGQKSVKPGFTVDAELKDAWFVDGLPSSIGNGGFVAICI